MIAKKKKSTFCRNTATFTGNNSSKFEPFKRRKNIDTLLSTVNRSYESTSRICTQRSFLNVFNRLV